jgi:hypothetical protein
MSPKPKPAWPAGIDPLISNEALFTAIACRSDACIIAMSRNLGSQGITETPYFFDGDTLQCLGLATMIQHDIMRDMNRQQEES